MHEDSSDDRDSAHASADDTPRELPSGSAGTSGPASRAQQSLASLRPELASTAHPPTASAACRPPHTPSTLPARTWPPIAATATRPKAADQNPPPVARCARSTALGLRLCSPAPFVLPTWYSSSQPSRFNHVCGCGMNFPPSASHCASLRTRALRCSRISSAWAWSPFRDHARFAAALPTLLGYKAQNSSKRSEARSRASSSLFCSVSVLFCIWSVSETAVKRFTSLCLRTRLVDTSLLN